MIGRAFFTAFILLSSQHLLAYPLSLQDALTTALQNNQKQKISQYDQQIAQARYEQAFSPEYPTLDFSLTFNRHDENFVDETQTNFTIPAGILGPNEVSMPIEYTHVVMGRDTTVAQLDASYALYTGGKISAITTQAQQGIEYAKEDKKLTESEIVFNIKKYYAASVLSDQLLFLTQETADRIEAIKEITEAFYNGDSLFVKKTDYLRVKLMLQSVYSMLLQMKTKASLARSALLFEMGEDTNASVELTDTQLHTVEVPDELQSYIESMFLYNHQLAQSEIGLKIRDAQIEEMQSDYLPTIALYAKAKKLENNLDGGIINDTNNESWDIGIALKLNLFSGHLTKYKVQEKEIEKLKLLAQQSYLKSALSLQTKNTFISLQRAIEQVKISQEALTIAKENSDLNFRGYQQGMIETKDVLEAQIFESMSKASYYKACYEVLTLEAKLNYTLGKSL